MNKCVAIALFAVVAVLAGCTSARTEVEEPRLVLKYEILDFEECSWKFIPDVIDPRHPGEFYVMLRPEYCKDVFLLPLNVDPKLRKSGEGYIRTNIKPDMSRGERLIVTLLDEDEISKGINSLLSDIRLEAGLPFFKLKKSTDTVAVLNEWTVCGEQALTIPIKFPVKNKPLIIDFEKIKLYLYYE